MAEALSRILDLRDLCKTFIAPDGTAHEAIRNVNLTIEDLPGKGEFRVFLGPSGCGKSTVLRIVAGLATPTSGQALLFGSPILGPGPDRGMVFQSYSSFPWLNVLDNVAFGLKLQGVSRKARHDMAREYIKRVGLEGSDKKYPKNLSGGMRQRVAIARTLATKPRMILMDEPFGALDVQTRLEMQDLILSIWSDIEATIIFVTHDIPEAVYLADEIIVFSAGPGTVAHRIRVDLPTPRTAEIKRSARFKQLVEYVLDQMHQFAKGGNLSITT